MEQGKPIRFAQLLELHLNNQVNKKFSDAVVNNETLHEMRALIKEQVNGIFKKSSHAVTQPGLDWLSNQLFKHVSLVTSEGKKLISELVIFNEYNLTSLPYSDIQLLRNLFNETQMGPELEEEYRKRSAA